VLKFVEVQTVEALLADSDSRSGDKFDTSQSHDQRSTEKRVGYSEVATEKSYEGQKFFLSLQIRKSVVVTLKGNVFTL
jgi:hypothetical protein